MLMTELITKKRDGGVLDKEEIDFMVEGYTRVSHVSSPWFLRSKSSIFASSLPSTCP